MAYLNFLLRITDIITSKLPNTAATIIDIIIDAFNIKNIMWNQLLPCSVCDPAVVDAIVVDVVVLLIWIPSRRNGLDGGPDDP